MIFSARISSLCSLWLLSVTISGHAAEIYVSPTGDNSAGTNWTTAYTNLQAVLDAARPTDTIYVAGQQFDLTTSLYWSATGSTVTIRGSYAAAGDDPLPGPQDFVNSPTILRGPVVTSNRVMYASFVTNGWVEGIVFTNGYGSGGGMYANACSLTITNCAFVKNRVISSARIFDAGTGGGLAVNTGRVTVVDTLFRENQWMWAGDLHKGAGAYLNIATGLFQRATFQDNTIIGQSYQYGAGFYANGGIFTLVDCVFSNNSCGANYARGAAVYASANLAAVFSNCVFINNYVGGNSQYGGAVTLDSVGTALVAGCVFKANAGESSGEDIWVGVTASTLIRDTVFAGGSSNGITCRYGTSVIISNCLIHSKSSSGILVSTGAVTVINSTLADNNGWGLSNILGTVTVKNSIAWGNYSGGMTTNRLDTSFSCSQELLPGTGNFSTNPLFALGYYLSVAGLTNQAESSTCIDAGTGNASDYGLDTKTTRTDGGGDNLQVDLGFHAMNGWSAAALSNRVLYVDIGSGSDITGDGWTPGTAFKTITKALTRTVQGGTINIAAGQYSTNNGETLPLLPKEVGLTLVGTSRDSVFINGSSTTQLIRVQGWGKLRFENISFTNGFTISSAVKGPGLYLVGCLTTLTNCAVVSNIIYAGGGSYGGGIFANEGALTLDGCTLAANGMASVGVGDLKYGGGIYAANNVNLVIRNSTVRGNFIYGQTLQYGGGIYAAGGAVLITNSIISGNMVGTYRGYGGGLHINGADSLVVVRTTCVSNYTSGTTASGAVAFVTGCGSVRISDCDIVDNIRAGSADDFALNWNAKTLFEYDNLRGGSRHGINYGGYGQLIISNCLVASQTNNGILFDTGTGRLVSVTLANNGGWGISNISGTVTAVNAIAWGNMAGGLTTNCAVSFSCLQEPVATGEGNITNDPLFADTLYFHEQSRGGTYTGGCFEAGGWASFPSNSPVIDRGDSTYSYQNEPSPNGLRINMGAYGNTAVASKSIGGFRTFISIR